jgi:hypothetical protein
MCLYWYCIDEFSPVTLHRERGFAPGVFGRFDLAALAQPQFENFVCLFVS